jgi:hypothetical protein
MGSGFKTFTAASVLTAADLNNFCQSQSVMYFATTAARDTAITSPVDGMVAYIGSNDADEGLYTYNGTAWRKGPGWNAPWGYMGHGSASATVTTSGTTEATLVSTGSFTAVSNRYYLVTYSGAFYGSVAGDQFDMRVRNNSISGTQLRLIILSNGFSGSTFYNNFSHSFVTTIAAGSSNGLFFTIKRSLGTGTMTSNDLSSPASITVTDIGPSGAPA